MKIQKRLPFGFRGDWGLLFKKYEIGETISANLKEIITHEDINYAEIGMDLQFKRVDEATYRNTFKIKGDFLEENEAIIETTDAYWDDEHKEYACVVKPLDIIKVLYRYWTVESIKVDSIYAPGKHDFFFLKVKEIAKDRIIINA